MPIRGRTLLLERTRLRVKQIDLAQRMGVHRNTVKRYEDLGEVPSEVAEQYRSALDTFKAQPESAA